MTLMRPVRVIALRVALAVVLVTVLVDCGSAQPRDAPIAEGRRALAVQGAHYGTLGADHPTSVRVREIFQRIVRAAGRRPGLVLEVYVLDTPRIIVEALRGGIVAISRGAVDLARGDENALAFLLGHEVAHEVRDHHGLLESLGVLGASAATDPRDEHVVRAYRAVELDADRLGVLFAALAGYRVSAAIPVLAVLVERSGPDLFHPQPARRADAIRSEIADIVDHLEIFRLGLVWLSLGRYLDAARVLEHFLSLFPAREVLSAIGVAYHEEAWRYAPAREFQHTLVVDATTRAPTTKGAATHPIFRQFVERALRYDALAVDADPSYAPAVVNLATAYLDLDEHELALGHLNRAVRLAPKLAAAYLNRGVALALTGDLARAEEDWRTAARFEPGLSQAAHNLARLYEVTGRPEEAKRWRVQAASHTKPIAPAIERIGAIVPGSPAVRVSDWMREPGSRELHVPLGPGMPDLTLRVLAQRGLALVIQRERIEAVAALARTGPATAGGLRVGDTASHIEAVYGPAERLDGVQAFNVRSYPARGLVVFLQNGRVQSIWVGHPIRRDR